MTTIWNDEKDNYIKRNYPRLSFKQIAKDIGHSVDAVRTRASKLGARQIVKNRIIKVEKKYALEYDIKPIQGTVSLRDITDSQCRYVTDTGADMMLCGADVIDGQNYCEAHCHVAYDNFGKKRDVNVKPIGGFNERNQVSDTIG